MEERTRSKLLDLATNFSKKDSYPRITQNGRLPKIPSDMSPRKRYLFRLKKQRDPSDLLAIALQSWLEHLYFHVCQ